METTTQNNFPYESRKRIKKNDISDREDKLLNSLYDFFMDKKHLEKMKPIVEGNSISLRVLDWFVTNYSKKNSVQYPIYIVHDSSSKDSVVAREKVFDVWTEYKSQLKLYSKEMFDPFCRLKNNSAPPPKKKRSKNKSRRLIQFYYDTGDEDYIETTMGQLNFFRWVITNGILDYINKHIKEIEQDMIQTHKEKKKNSLEKAKAVKMTVGTGRQKTTISAAKLFSKKQTNIIVSFD